MEEEKTQIICFGCDKIIVNKPWMTVNYKNDNIIFHTCNYLCSAKLDKKLGAGNYWDKIENKEDFTGELFIRPVVHKKQKTYLTDIQKEIRDEQIEFDKIEKLWENISDDSSEDNFE